MLTKLDDTVEPDLANKLTIFLLKVTGRVSGDVTDTPVEMRRGLTQGGTLSPALFKLFIDSLPEEVRTALRDADEDAPGLDPLRLVADDVVGLTESMKGLQIVLGAFEAWAERNGLHWNPIKSQVLQLEQEPGVEEVSVTLDGTQLKVYSKVAYLGLQLTRDRFRRKEHSELTSKGTAAVYMLLSETWFSLELSLKHIARAYQTYVRSMLTYVVELLSSKDRFELEKLDEKLVTTMLTRLLGLGRERDRLAEKDIWSL